MFAKIKFLTLTLLLILTVSNSALQVDYDVNRSVDVLLDGLRFILDNDYSSGVPFGPIETSFKGKWFGSFLKVTVDVKTSESRLQGLTSVRRYQDVIYSVTPASVTFTLKFIFDRLTARFDRISLQARVGSVSGSGELKVSRLNGGFTVTMHQQDNTCLSSILDDLWIEDIGRVSVTYNDMNRFSYVFGKITEEIIRNVKDDLRLSLEEYLKDAVLRFMDRVDVCAVLLDVIS